MSPDQARSPPCQPECSAEAAGPPALTQGPLPWPGRQCPCPVILQGLPTSSQLSEHLHHGLTHSCCIHQVQGLDPFTIHTQNVNSAPLQQQARRPRNKAGTFQEYCSRKQCMNHFRQRLLPKGRACPSRVGSPPLELSLQGRRTGLPCPRW